MSSSGLRLCMPEHMDDVYNTHRCTHKPACTCTQMHTPYFHRHIHTLLMNAPITTPTPRPPKGLTYQPDPRTTQRAESSHKSNKRVGCQSLLPLEKPTSIRGSVEVSLLDITPQYLPLLGTCLKNMGSYIGLELETTWPNEEF